MEIVAVAFAALFVLLFLGVPLALGMGLVGVAGFAIGSGWSPALNMAALTTLNTVLNYSFSVLPLFIMMGAFFAHSRMAEELYSASYAFLGHRRGGLAMATIMACGCFGAISGSAMACAATMTRVSVPMMRRYGYPAGFAAGTVAAGATLDILIPPSNPMVIYAILTEVDLGKLMIAGLLPGLLTVGVYTLSVVALGKLSPSTVPRGERTGWHDRLVALRDIWPMLVLLSSVLGGIYLGIFTPTEAAGIGAFGAFLIAFIRRRLSLRLFGKIMVETAKSTSTVFFVVVGAIIFANFVTAAGATTALDELIKSFKLEPTELILVILATYIVLGCILEGTAMMLLTVPIFFPVVTGAGIDPIWFGIFVVIMAGVASIHPPLGLLLFVVRSLVPDIRIGAMFVGVLPYLAGDAVRVALLIAFPAIVLALPRLMN